MFVAVMTVLAAAILGVGFLQQPPSAEMVFQEDESVAIVLTDVRGLSADSTEIQLRGEGDCGQWDSSGTLKKGDVTIVERNDCPDPLEKGDVLQVVSPKVLLDTYEVRGNWYDRCDALTNGNDLTVSKDDSPLKCDIVGDDGGRADIKVTINEDAELIGTVKLSDSSESDFNIKQEGKFTGTLNSDSMPTIKDKATINGDITLPEEPNGDTLKLNQDTEMNGSIKTIDEEVQLKSNVIVRGDIIVEGSGMDPGVDLGENVLVDGDIDANGHSVDVSESANVTGTITQNG
ncbi:hypothetical protein C489_16645 [Natrinema versiforme JCM 10478]|uniref:Archaeal Type IV pilin N-terminal domain-containing protein n=2 Tax=Natrinema versiforme TaxID=88724 RepID=L9XT34_9EURY|nr:hypothetical protein C489_16645 [Natrinema versiforme JCM 10478]